MERVIESLVQYRPADHTYRGCGDTGCALTSSVTTLSDSDELTLRLAAKIAKRLGKTSLHSSLLTLLKR